MAASLSDYTLGWAGNGWYIDEILRDHPEIHGAALARESHDCSGVCEWKSPFVSNRSVDLTPARRYRNQ